jgi:DNA-binding MurR/RpiR family transcriptional regulator
MPNTNVRLDLADAGRELSTLLGQRQLYEKVIRETQWMQGPITIVASGASNVAGLAAARTFEWLLGVTVSVRDIAEFESYLLPALRPRSVLIAVSPSGEDQDFLETIQKARRSGSTALALTPSSEGPLAKACHAAFVLPWAEESQRGLRAATKPTGLRSGSGDGLVKNLPQKTRNSDFAMQAAARTAFLEHGALLYVACVAADIFNPRHALAGSWEQEFAELPDHLQWAHAHLSNAAQSFADAIRHARHAVVTGGGLYHASALQAARLARQLPDSYVQDFELHDLLDDASTHVGQAYTALVASGSGCRVKKAVHTAAAKLKAKGVRILSVTDGIDQELVRRSSLAILLPRLCEVSGSLLQVAVLQWIMLLAAFPATE